MPQNTKALQLIGGSYKGKNPIKYLLQNHLLPQMEGHKTLRAIQHYASDFESPFAADVFSTEHTSIKLNMIYLHSWLMTYHMR